jgi:hypothetical protein
MVGATDAERLACATQRDRVIVTHNRRHFQREHNESLRQHQPRGGIIILPQRGTFERLELRAAMTLDRITIESVPCQSRLFLWNDLQLRLAHGLQLAGYTAGEIKQALGQSP